MTRFTIFVLFGCSGAPKSAPPPPPPPPPDAAVAEATEPAEPEPHTKDMISKTPTELAWAPLDPANASGSQVAPLWGDMSSGASGFFLRLPAGDPGALHTHAFDYHAVSLSGTVSNRQDGDRKRASLPPHAYWYQPGAVAHTTSCAKGADCIFLVHPIGRFDFAPATPAKGAKPDPRYVEKRPGSLRFEPLADLPGAQIARLWGDAEAQPSGFFLKLAPNQEPFWHIHRFDYHAVVLAGTVVNVESGDEPRDLPAGSYYLQPGGYKHTTSCKAGPCLLYLYFTGAYDIKAM